jgi:hypothetical protein
MDISPLIIGGVVVVFNAGGIFYLVKNHFPHVNRKLDRILAIQINHGERISHIEGALHLPLSRLTRD